MNSPFGLQTIQAIGLGEGGLGETLTTTRLGGKGR